MRKTLLRVLPIALSLGAPAGWAEYVSLDHAPMSPTQAALAERVLAQLLTATGGEAALFRKVTGAERLPTQELFVSIPAAALQTGRISYPREPQFVVATVWDLAAQCQLDASATAPTAAANNTSNPSHDRDGGGVQAVHLPAASVNSNRTYSVANTGMWSAVGGEGLARALAIEVSPEYLYDQGIPYQAFSFLASGQHPADAPATVLRFEAPLTAAYGTKVVYRKQTVVQRGARLPFVATAQVTSAAPLQFNVRTLGASSGFYFDANEQRVMHLANMPANGAAVAATDARLGARVLTSPDGAYLLGRESGTATSGAYSLVDAVHSQRPASGPGTLSRIWTTRTKGACSHSDLALNTAGDLVAVCDGVATWIYKNTDGSRPCRYLAITNAGALVCYSEPIGAGDPGAVDKTVFRTADAVKPPDPAVLVNTQHPYALTWLQLTGSAQQDFSFSGEYSGDRVVTPVISCQDDPVKLPAPRAACERAVQTTSANVQCADARAQVARLRGKALDTAVKP